MMGMRERFSRLREGMQSALLKWGQKLADNPELDERSFSVDLAGAWTRLTEHVEDLLKRNENLEEWLEEATTDPVTGLLKTRQWGQQLMMSVQAALASGAVEAILDGTFPLSSARLAGLDQNSAVTLVTFDVRGLGYTNDTVGYDGGSTMLRMCAESAQDELEVFLGARGAQQRLRYEDDLAWCSLTRSGGDELRAVLFGLAAKHWRPMSERLLIDLRERSIPGLDIVPDMAIGSMTMHIAMWYYGEFYREILRRPQPEDQKVRAEEIIALWLKFTELRANAQRITEYGLLFVEEWDDDPNERQRFERWLGTKLKVSAFNGLNEQQVRVLCAKAAAALREGDPNGARTVFEHDRDERMRKHLHRLVAEARAMTGESIPLAMEIFAIACEYELPIPPP